MSLSASSPDARQQQAINRADPKRLNLTLSDAAPRVNPPRAERINEALDDQTIRQVLAADAEDLRAGFSFGYAGLSTVAPTSGLR